MYKIQNFRDDSKIGDAYNEEMEDRVLVGRSK